MGLACLAACDAFPPCIGVLQNYGLSGPNISHCWVYTEGGTEVDVTSALQWHSRLEPACGMPQGCHLA